MRMLIDSVTVGSGGMLQLRDELSRAAARQAPERSSVVLLAASSTGELPPSDNLTIVPVEKPKWGWGGRWWWYNRTLPRLARQYEADVVYSLSGILTARARRDMASITTVNNMIPFSPAEMKRFPLLSGARLRFTLLRRLYAKSLRRADSVVLHSQHALRLVTPRTGDISKKTFVALPGVPSDVNRVPPTAVRPPHGGRPYLLYLSAFFPYKNHFRLIEGYKKSLEIEPDLPDLLLAGPPLDRIYFQAVMKAVADLGLGTRIRHVGILSRSEIPAWISNAVINIFASTCETNPLTVGEVLALGGVLACSNSAPMPEIAGDSAGYFDPYSADSISETMVGLFRDQARRLALQERGRNRAAQFSWDDCGTQIWRAALAARANYEERKPRIRQSSA